MIFDAELLFQLGDFSINQPDIHRFFVFITRKQYIFWSVFGFDKLLNMCLITIFFHDQRTKGIRHYFGLSFE